MDYIFRWLGVTFLPGYREAVNGHAAEKRRRLWSKDASRPAAFAEQAAARLASLQTLAPTKVGGNGKSFD